MKISIGSKVVDGPWGGGNLFVKNLAKYLTSKGHKVIYNLCEPDINLILLTDPRNKLQSSSTFNHNEIKKYKKYVNKHVRVVQRINECDERKNTTSVNNLYLEASDVADKVVFVSSWLKDIYIKLGLQESKSKVILAGADSKIFNSQHSLVWNNKEKFKLVTHHWSNHKLKGFEDYKKVDEMLNQDIWRNKIEFTYIGNMNANYSFNNIKILEPLTGKHLANEIKKHHFYLTSSINEPSGNHHIEAAQCGLPIIYKLSGGMPEYCQGFGVGYQDNVEDAINIAMNNYKEYKSKINKYPNNSLKMSQDFLELFESLVVYLKPNQEFSMTKFGRAYLEFLKFKKNIINFYFIIYSFARKIKRVILNK
jgi:hypothetical protein